MAQETQTFGKWRSLLWPIHTYELKKVVPMVLLFFLILFNYTILRDMKDTLIVTASGSGAEAIPFLKFWGVVPGAIAFTLFYAKMSNILSKPALFYTSVSIFLVFFGLFAFVLYPAKDVIHPYAFCDWLQSVLPSGFAGLIAILRNWSYSLFYIMSELWGSSALSLMFWGFANDITKVHESKRFYPLFGMFGNVALIASGNLIQYFSRLRGSLAPGADPWQMTLNYLIGLVLLSGLVIIAIYWWMQKNVLTDPRFYDPNEVKQGKKQKTKMSIKESFLYLMKSRYLGCIALLVIGYGISINLVEVTWKSQLKLKYPDPNEYNAFMGFFSEMTGYVTILMMLFVGGNVMRLFGWTTAAMITPVVLLITGALFFSFIIFRDQLAGVVATLGTNPLTLAVIFGMIQNIASKSTKYSLFDPTKETAYIPLDQESKVKGKAAVDVVGARLGKSGGGLVQQGMILTFGSLAASTPYIGAVMFVVIGAWLVAVKALGKQFAELTSEKESTAKEATLKPAAV